MFFRAVSIQQAIRHEVFRVGSIFEMDGKNSTEEGDVLVVALHHDSACVDGVCCSGPC